MKIKNNNHFIMKGLLIIQIIILGILYNNIKLYESYDNIILSYQEIIKTNNDIIKSQDDIIIKKIELNKKLKKKIVTATAYTKSPDECNSDPEYGAILRKVKPGRSIAVSRDMMHLLGKQVYIEGLGIRFVEDLMNPQYTKRIDLLVDSKDKAFEFGVKTLQLVVLQ